ncbi:MAG: tetratricopeptide repeat protein [Treponema sp.]|jgi:tetratricopeptide (TPR) repeat protein|nr:tetratricopeptide repeat protein [Treponema sp.]
MLRALELISDRDLGASEFGRVMNGVNTVLIMRIYPDTAAPLPSIDLPQTHVYARILREAERGNYVPPPADSTDFLEHVLPFLALFAETRRERLLLALPDLEKARRLRPDSVLAPFFLGMVFERLGQLEEAEAAYTQAYHISEECYPAMLGLVRVIGNSGRKQQVPQALSELAIRFPDNMEIKRQLALAYYENGDWSRAEPAVAEILRRDSRDGDFILMRAHILVELGRFAQAQAPLDLYAAINPGNRLYLFLRARLQAEGYRNRDSALNYLRSILRLSPGDEEALAYAARLLMESPRPEDEAEGRELLGRLLNDPDPSLPVLSLALRDAIRRENWREAQGFVNRLLNRRRSNQDLLDAYTVELGLGNKSRALSYARELYERDTANDEGAAAYISALIDADRREEAGRMIESRLSVSSGGPAKSRYYYLRSRLRTNEEAALSDLRSSLFEAPRNLDTLIATFEIYHRRKDQRRALYYLKQALAIAPDNPRLKRYEREYAGVN